MDPEAVVRRYWREVWSEGRDDAVQELYAEDTLLDGERVSVESFREGVRRHVAGFPDFRADVQQVLVHDDWVVTRVRYSGTQTGPSAIFPPSGRVLGERHGHVPGPGRPHRRALAPGGSLRHVGGAGRGDLAARAR